MEDIFFIIFPILFIVGIVLYRKFFRPAKFGAVTLITGGVKSGKSALSVNYAVKEYQKVHLRWRIRWLFQKMLRKPVDEEPLLYSNIPLRKIKYSPLTLDHLLRKVRFRYKSIVFIDEASLLADAMLGVQRGNDNVNTQLQLFFKLFGHETHGGKCIVNSHCISDLHYALKRVTSDYYYIESFTKLPFVSYFNVRRDRHSEDKSTALTLEDPKNTQYRVLMFNTNFKKYDCYCYSSLTDDLTCSAPLFSLRDWCDVKSTNLVSFRKEFQELYAKKNHK